MAKEPTEIKEITEEEVKQHNTEKDLWMIIDNNVYDVTKFTDEHPGGADILVEHAGVDATLAFEEVGHSEDARKLLQKYKIGIVKGGSQKYCSAAACTTRSTPSVSFRLQEDEAKAKRDKSVTSAKTSSCRICPASTESRTKHAPNSDLERTKSITSTPSRLRCISCCRDSKSTLDRESMKSDTSAKVPDSRTKLAHSSIPITGTPSRVRSTLDRDRTKSDSSAKVPSKITKPVSSRPGSHSDVSKTKPATVRPASQTEKSRTPAKTADPVTLANTEPERTKSAANGVPSRHKGCFVEPPDQWRVKSATAHGLGLRTPQRMDSVTRLPNSDTYSKSETSSKSVTGLKPESSTESSPIGPKPGTKTTPEPDPFEPPEDSSVSSDMWKYAVVALAGAIVVAVVVLKTRGNI